MRRYFLQETLQIINHSVIKTDLIVYVKCRMETGFFKRHGLA